MGHVACNSSSELGIWPFQAKLISQSQFAKETQNIVSILHSLCLKAKVSESLKPLLNKIADFMALKVGSQAKQYKRREELLIVGEG